MMRRGLPSLLLSLWLLAAGTVFFGRGAAASEAPIRLRFGVVPQQTAIKLAEAWGPVLDYLSRRTGYELFFDTAKDIPKFEERVLEKRYDVAYMNPYHYVAFHALAGYNAFAREKGKKIRGIVVVRKDSPIAAISELRGRSLAFPSPAAFAAAILPRSEFFKMGIEIDPVYVSSHDSVYRAVAGGLYPAGGGVMRTFASAEPDVREKLRILWRTPGYTPHAFAARPDVPKAVIDNLVRAMTGMADHPAARELLAPLKMEGFEPGDDDDWDDVRDRVVGLFYEFIRKPRIAP